MNIQKIPSTIHLLHMYTVSAATMDSVQTSLLSINQSVSVYAICVLFNSKL